MVGGTGQRVKKELFEVKKIFYILIVVMVIRLYMSVKTRSTCN